MAGKAGVWKLTVAAALDASAVETALAGRDAAVELKRVDFRERETAIFVAGTRAGAEHVVLGLRAMARQVKTSLSEIRAADIHRLG